MNLEETKNFVKKAHEKQLRKYPENTPYYTHLFRVGDILSEYEFSESCFTILTFFTFILLLYDSKEFKPSSILSS